MDQALDIPSSNGRTIAAHAVAAIVQQIETSIADGSWPPGFQLPTERLLEVEFGVARNTLRKGLKRLEDAGKIVRHVGRGSFVADLPASGPSDAQLLLDRVVGSSPAEVMEVRLLLEPWAAALAATRATASDLSHMRHCVSSAALETDIIGFELWDEALHKCIVAAAKNGLLAGLYEAINMARQQPEWIKLKARTTTPERRARYHAQHSDIVEALGERDPEKASDLIRSHLLAVRFSLVGF